MPTALILGLLQLIPPLFAEVQTLIANGAIKDQATVDAAIKAQQAVAETDFAKLLSDFGQSDPG